MSQPARRLAHAWAGAGAGGEADGGAAADRTGVAVEAYYVSVQGRAFHVPQRRLLAASVPDLEFALADAQPLPSLQARRARDRVRVSAARVSVQWRARPCGVAVDLSHPACRRIDAAPCCGARQRAARGAALPPARCGARPQAGAAAHNERPAAPQALVERLKETTDIVFPTAPDVAGGPGELQRLLEAAGVPFVGAGSDAVALADDRLACAHSPGAEKGGGGAQGGGLRGGGLPAAVPAERWPVTAVGICALVQLLGTIKHTALPALCAVAAAAGAARACGARPSQCLDTSCMGWPPAAVGRAQVRAPHGRAGLPGAAAAGAG